ncbi:MAG: HEPN domain-containing protein [Candidatus Thiosymbion ectosymbiont of Robbea hypermnestra]|nr:HEPN domain-containing protein [Candidatus Thiosymbion ectosymbiont of Robbea hypermnestra]
MNLQYTQEIEANLNRAREAISAARGLLREGYPDFAASRSYYAAFYAATALLLREGLEFKKHSGVIATIHQRFVKTGKIDKKHGKNLNWLYELRSVGDYGVTIHVPGDEAKKAIIEAEGFLNAIQEIIRKG